GKARPWIVGAFGWPRLMWVGYRACQPPFITEAIHLSHEIQLCIGFNPPHCVPASRQAPSKGLGFLGSPPTPAECHLRFPRLEAGRQAYSRDSRPSVSVGGMPPRQNVGRLWASLGPWL